MEGTAFSYYHLYLRGNNHQSIFYESSDYIQIMNRLAIAAHKTNTSLLASTFLSNHFHLVAYTSNPGAFMHYFRISFSYFFNKKYNSIGNVGTRKYGRRLIIDPEIDGGDDLKDVISYVLRNPFWHSIETNFRKYPWSTVRLYYNEPSSQKQIDSSLVQFFLPGRISLPGNYIMHENGLISPYCYHDTSFVEKLFGSYDNFIEHTNAPSNIEIKSIASKGAENGKKKPNVYNEVLNSDIMISEYIMNTLLPDIGKTIPELGHNEKLIIAKMAHHKFPEAYRRQLSRILSIPETTLRRHLK